MKVKATQSCPTLCNPMDYSLAGSLSMEFSRQEYWNGSLFPSPGDLPNPGIEPGCPTLQVDSLPSEPTGSPRIFTGFVCLFFLSCEDSREFPFPVTQFRFP